MARRKKAKTPTRTRKTGLKVQAIAFVQISDLVPKTWHNWFWETIADGAPFSWGDNDYSIISIKDFLNWCERCIDIDEDSHITQEELDTFYRRLRSLGNLWLDLECKSFPNQW